MPNDTSPGKPTAALVTAVESLKPADAESTLAQLASALFPGGEGEFSQLTWTSNLERELRSRTQERRQDTVERQLRAADLRYRTLVEQIPAVTFLAVLGEGDNEIYVSPYIESLLGFTQKEWLENPFLWYSQLHPDDRALWQDEFTRGIQTGGPFRAECRFIARDGRVVWVRGEARLVKDERGRPLFLQGVAFDITESKRAHRQELREAVRSTEQRYRDLVEHLDAMFWEARADTGEFTFVSRGIENILGVAPEEWLSDPGFWLTRVHPDERDAVAATWAQVLASDAEREFEFRALGANNREVWLHVRAQRQLAESSERRLFGVMLDITQRRRGEEERARLLKVAEDARRAAEEANRAKDEFLATMSHELKTPLNALLGYSQLLRAKQLPDDLVDRALESLERNAKVQAKLVDDLLDVSRIVTGKLPLEVKPVVIAEIIRAVLDTLRLAAEAKRLTVNVDIDQSRLIVAGDAARLQQVVWNLLSNAIKFTPESGHVDVSLTRVDGYARVRVADSGQGLSPEFLPHVFERFRQADSSITRRHGGLGLGLAIVRHLVEMHGGSIAAESPGLGLGATFTVFFPLIESAGKIKESSPRRLDGSHTLDRVRILIVDDEPDALELLRTVFVGAGAEVSLARSAAEAMAQVQRDPPNVLVSDIGMPNEDGYSLLRRIRQSGAPFASVPAVALSAYTGADHQRQAHEAGYQEHLPKPVDISQIVNVVARLANGSRNGARA